MKRVYTFCDYCILYLMKQSDDLPLGWELTPGSEQLTIPMDDISITTSYEDPCMQNRCQKCIPLVPAHGDGLTNTMPAFKRLPGALRVFGMPAATAAKQMLAKTVWGAVLLRSPYVTCRRRLVALMSVLYVLPVSLSPLLHAIMQSE